MTKDGFDPLYEKEIRERAWYHMGIRLIIDDPFEHYADSRLESQLDLSSHQAVAVLGSALVLKQYPGYLEQRLELSPLTAKRLEAGVACLREGMALVTCGRNTENSFLESDAKVMAEDARQRYRVSNPIIALPEPFNTFGEVVQISKLAKDQQWKKVIIVTNKAFTNRAASMAYSLKLMDVYHYPYEDMRDYLERLYFANPKRRVDIEKIRDSFYDLAINGSYKGSFSFVCPADEREKPMNIDTWGDELTGRVLWHAGRYR